MTRIVIDGQRQPKQPSPEIRLRDLLMPPPPQPLTRELTIEEFLLAGGWLHTEPGEMGDA